MLPLISWLNNATSSTIAKGLTGLAVAELAILSAGGALAGLAHWVADEPSPTYKHKVIAMETNRPEDIAVTREELIKREEEVAKITQELRKTSNPPIVPFLFPSVTLVCSREIEQIHIDYIQHEREKEQKASSTKPTLNKGRVQRKNNHHVQRGDSLDAIIFKAFLRALISD